MFELNVVVPKGWLMQTLSLTVTLLTYKQTFAGFGQLGSLVSEQSTDW